MVCYRTTHLCIQKLAPHTCIYIRYAYVVKNAMPLRIKINAGTSVENRDNLAEKVNCLRIPVTTRMQHHLDMKVIGMVMIIVIVEHYPCLRSLSRL